MKLKILCFSLQLIFFLSLCNITWAQGDKNSLIFSGTLAHYIRSGEKSDIKGFYNYPVSPGVEVLYQYKFSKFSYLSSGVNYQRGRFANYMEAHDRFRFGEISVPIIFKQVLMQKDKKNLLQLLGFLMVQWYSYHGKAQLLQVNGSMFQESMMNIIRIRILLLIFYSALEHLFALLPKMSSPFLPILNID